MVFGYNIKCAWEVFEQQRERGGSLARAALVTILEVRTELNCEINHRYVGVM